MLDYNWTCHVCSAANRPALDSCESCGFPAVASGTEIVLARRTSVRPDEATSIHTPAHRIPPPLTLVQLVGLVALVWAAGLLPILILQIVGTAPSKLQEAGQLGDTFGAINALFSGLAFAGVAYAIFLQRQDLSLQREELSKTSGASLRQVHIALQQMAIEDKDLQDVWELDTYATTKERKQHLYVNLVLSNWETLFANGSLTAEQLRTTALLYMKRPAFRTFWTNAVNHRKAMANVGNKSAIAFHEIMQGAFDDAQAPAPSSSSAPASTLLNEL